MWMPVTGDQGSGVGRGRWRPTVTEIGKPPPSLLSRPTRTDDIPLFLSSLSLPSGSGTGRLRSAVSVPATPPCGYHRSVATRAASFTPHLVTAHQHRSSFYVSTGLTSVLVVRKLSPVTLASEMDGTTPRTPTTLTAYRSSDMGCNPPHGRRGLCSVLGSGQLRTPGGIELVTTNGRARARKVASPASALRNRCDVP